MSEERNRPQHPTQYAMALNIIARYCRPGLDSPAYEDLKARASDPHDNGIMAIFKSQLRMLLTEPAILNSLRPDAVRTASGHDEPSDAEYLWKLWKDLWGDEDPTVRPEP